MQKLIGGNAVIQVKLTPSVAENHSELRLTPELGPFKRTDRWANFSAREISAE
jgi:hypothetical protein